MNPPSSEDEVINPMMPTTNGALLAEEWSINPKSTLPSFLEMMMMEEARRSGYEALKSAFLHAENRLTEFAETPDSSTSESPTIGLTMIFNRLNWLELKKKMARTLVERVLKPWGPECRLFIVYLLQRGSLMSKNATVSESLYGGKRVKLGLQENNQRRLVPMPKRDGVRLAFLISFGPYLTERADMLYNKLGQMGDDESASLSQKIRKIFKVVYPLLHMSAQGMHLLEQWKYLLGHSLFFDPYSKWLDLVVRRVTEQDQPEKKNTNSSESNKPAVLENTLDKSRSLIANSNVKAAALGILSSALFIGWIARVRATRPDLQRRISNSSRLGGGGRQQHNVLPPPPPPPPAKNIDLASLPAHICPLCRQPKINPTASTGGYVFCFKCITAHVRETETCPITGRACPESRLVRLYEPNSG